MGKERLGKKLIVNEGYLCYFLKCDYVVYEDWWLYFIGKEKFK